MLVKTLALLGLSLSMSVNAASLTFVTKSPTGSTSTEPGYSADQGAYAEFMNTQNIALGKTATVSSAYSGAPAIHNSAFITDGKYGNGRSWIGVGPNSWLTIDLGSSQSFSTLSFGRDRLGHYNDRDPGQFTILTSDDNSSFTEIFDSSDFTFDGTLASDQTVQATFDTATAQYVRLELAYDGAAIDEVEITAVPLPAAAWVFISALGGLVVAKRKQPKA